jgi:hypothetical protein
MHYPFLRIAVTGVCSNWVAILSTARSVKQKIVPSEKFFSRRPDGSAGPLRAPERNLPEDKILRIVEAR